MWRRRINSKGRNRKEEEKQKQVSVRDAINFKN